ncbi:MAG: DUF2442 domain-containing protein [Syntrophomonadaceae bacterium]|nr:DUF2442 domain-containing protein [Syntrophomonadaceae bacterium]
MGEIEHISERSYYPSIHSAKFNNDFTLEALFENGAIKHFDMKPLIKENPWGFGKLTDLNIFKQGEAWHNFGVHWRDDIEDLDEGLVYAEGKTIKAAKAITAMSLLKTLSTRSQVFLLSGEQIHQNIPHVHIHVQMKVDRFHIGEIFVSDQYRSEDNYLCKFKKEYKETLEYINRHQQDIEKLYLMDDSEIEEYNRILQSIQEQ